MHGNSMHTGHSSANSASGSPPDRVQKAVLGHLQIGAQYEGVDGEMCRLLSKHGTWFTKRRHVPAAERGAGRACSHNSVYQCALPLCCGIGINSNFGLPVGHCWNLSDDETTVYDTTWEEQGGDYYFGIRFPKKIADEILSAATHGNEVMDCWRSAARNVDSETLERWRIDIREHITQAKRTQAQLTHNVHNVGNATEFKGVATEGEDDVRAEATAKQHHLCHPVRFVSAFAASGSLI